MRDRSPAAEKNLVGRYFANHPETDFAEFQLDSKLPGHRFYRGMKFESGDAMPFLAPSAATQRQFRLVKTWLQVRRVMRKSADGNLKRDEPIALLAFDMDHLDSGKRPNIDGPGDQLTIRAICEQAPNPQSRVFLGEQRDRFGQQRAVLDWQLSELDNESAREMIKILTRETGIAGLGRVKRVFPNDGFATVDVRGSFHHMRTTRMHEDPSRGVVDANCRLHGISNLYVAGSSVFPTTGTSNPTYTILALAFRLAGHLEAQLKAQSWVTYSSAAPRSAVERLSSSSRGSWWRLHRGRACRVAAKHKDTTPKHMG